ncbi:CAP domain-containing protein [Anaerospora hongkongensis]|uniref:CAP domain-containing protein n=1 Tax=Anaerospora hongkongensis TaxID=244830 RepID=UPI00289B6101|nr:CAP domain-containing protein [Anaerospora hongkongensis]
MKKVVRNLFMGFLGTTIGLYMMVTPASVYAKSQQISNTVGKITNLTAQKNQSPSASQVTQDPVAVVKASAGKLGFNAKKDSFSLASKSANQAVVSVRHEKNIYNVTLKLNSANSQWVITSVNKAKGAESNSSVNNNGTVNNGSTTTGTTSSSTSSANVAAAEKNAVELMNADRRANGLSDLKVSSAVTAVARSHAQDMVNRKFFSHSNPDGKTPSDRLKAAGISYSAVGENIAENTSVQAAETAFMNSSGHRANILNSNYTTVGIGVAYDSAGNVYVVQDFIK